MTSKSLKLSTQPPDIAKVLEILQIVPRLPPHTDGVGDYALCLGEQLWRDRGIYSHFLPFTLGLDYSPLDNGFSIASLSAHTPEALMAACPNSVQGIVLHYSNYPYIKGQFNAPFWLPAALQRLLEARNIPLMVMFHELPTLDLKLLKVFNPWQSQVSRQLASLANGVVTDSHRFKEVLSKWTSQPVPCIPDFSNIGEPDVVPPLCDRQPQLIIFGGHDRGRIYRNHLHALLKVCYQLQIKEVIDIGKPLNLDHRRFGGIKLTEMGFQPSQRVSQILLNSRVGMIDYSRFPGDLGKSSVFAAFTAHGMLPLLTKYNPSEKDGVVINQHYLTPQTLHNFPELIDCQKIATMAHDWYMGHTLKKNAEVFYTQFLEIEKRSICIDSAC